MQKHLKANLHIVEMVADQEREGERREASLSWSCRIPEVTSAWFHERTECWAAPFLAPPIPYKGLTHLNIQAYFYTAVSNSVLNKRVVVTGLGWPLDPRLWELFGVQTQLEPPPPLTAGRSTMLLSLSPGSHLPWRVFNKHHIICPRVSTQPPPHQDPSDFSLDTGS